MFLCTDSALLLHSQPSYFVFFFTNGIFQFPATWNVSNTCVWIYSSSALYAFSAVSRGIPQEGLIWRFIVFLSTMEADKAHPALTDTQWQEIVKGVTVSILVQHKRPYPSIKVGWFMACSKCRFEFWQVWRGKLHDFYIQLSMLITTGLFY